MAKTLMLYGPSGSCKTSALATFVTGMHRATGKRARLYNVDDIGVILYEGLTGFSERLLDNMTDKLAAGDGKIGGDIAVKFTDGREKIGGLTQSAYGVAQRRAKNAVDESRLIPVPWVIWTAHKDRGTDDMKRVP